LDNEIGAWQWSAIYQELQRLEIRGEIRRGYFAQGLPGLQFALPEVVTQLRKLAQPDEADQTDDVPAQLVVLNACDPANVFSMFETSAEAKDNHAIRPALPAAYDGQPLRFSRIPSTWLVLDNGMPILLIEETGGSLTTVAGMDDVLTRQAIRAWLEHARHFENRITVHKWNGESVLNSPGQPLLEALGFYRDYPGMAWERR
jgi:ATP-dependent Lhr-like helicase